MKNTMAGPDPRLEEANPSTRESSDRAPKAGSAVETPSETEAIPLPPPTPLSASAQSVPASTWRSKERSPSVHHWNRVRESTPRDGALRGRATHPANPSVRSRTDMGPKHATRFSEVAPRQTQTLTWDRAYRRRLRISDWAAVAAAVLLAHTFKLGLGGWELDQNYLWISVGIFVLWCLDLEFGSSRMLRVLGTGVAEYKAVAHSAMRVFVISAVALIILQGGVLRGFFLVVFPLGLLTLLLSRWLWRKYLSRQRRLGNYLNDAVVIGRFVDVENVITMLHDNPLVGYRVAGVGLNSLPAHTSLSKPWYRIPVMSTLDDVEVLVRAAGAHTVIVAGTLPGGSEQLQQLGWRLEDLSTELVLASRLTNVAGPRVHLQPVEGMPLMHVELPQFSGGRHLAKRLMDLTLSTLALVVLSPVFAALALLVRIDSKGPVFYSQERVGRNGQTFRMYKFRSMVANADELQKKLDQANEGAGPLFKMKDDPRVTRTGKWMRKLSLDELPQLFNVVTGDMSLVGPRPPLAREVDAYEKPVHRRLLIKPGITGLWQISGRSNLSWEESVRLDLYYVENWSLLGDLMIMWRTGKAMVSAEGAY